MSDVALLLVVGAWGGITVFLAGMAFYFRLQMVKAHIALNTVQVMSERPNVAVFTPEQVDNLAALLIPRINGNGKKEYVQ